MESTTGYTFTPCMGSFTSPGIDPREKGSTAFSVSSERHRDSQSNVESQVFTPNNSRLLPLIEKSY